MVHLRKAFYSAQHRGSSTAACHVCFDSCWVAAQLTMLPEPGHRAYVQALVLRSKSLRLQVRA